MVRTAALIMSYADQRQRKMVEEGLNNERWAFKRAARGVRNSFIFE
jgi:hypothetical protein